MSFSIVQNPTFTHTVKLTRAGQQEPGVVVFTFTHLGNKAFKAWMGEAADGKGDVAWLGKVISGWGPEMVDQHAQPLPYSAAALEELLDQFPAAGMEIYHQYVAARIESRAGN